MYGIARAVKAMVSIALYAAVDSAGQVSIIIVCSDWNFKFLDLIPINIDAPDALTMPLWKRAAEAIAFI